jgi:hypothetical protein
MLLRYEEEQRNTGVLSKTHVEQMDGIIGKKTSLTMEMPNDLTKNTIIINVSII